MRQTTYIPDCHDFCRTCRGFGTVSYNDGGKSISERCTDCGGSGHKCVRLSQEVA